MFEQIGPTPRICIDLLLRGSQRIIYEAELENAVRSLSLDVLKTLASNIQDLDMNDASLKVFLVSRTQRFEFAKVAPITSYVKSRLVGKLQGEERKRRVKFYRDLECVPDGSPLAGLVYESLAHQMLGAKVNLDLVPMVKLDGPTEGKKLPQWHSSHQPLDDGALEALRYEALQRTINIQFAPSTTREYEGIDPDVDQGVYYVSRSKHQVGFDSFIYANDGFLYILQFTISLSHRINSKVVGFFGQILPLPMGSWRFVFIIPPGLTITSPQHHDHRLDGLELFSAVVTPSEWYVLSPQQGTTPGSLIPKMSFIKKKESIDDRTPISEKKIHECQVHSLYIHTYIQSQPTAVQSSLAKGKSIPDRVWPPQATIFPVRLYLVSLGYALLTEVPTFTLNLYLSRHLGEVKDITFR